MSVRRRRLKLAAVVLFGAASLALHAGLAIVVGPLLHGAATPESPEPAAPPVQVRRVESPAAPPPAETAQLPVAPTSPAPSDRPASAARARPAPAQPTYYEVSEVDIPATPQPDWNIDAAGLAVVGVRRLSFEVFIGADGIAQRCQVLAMEPPIQDAWPAIAARLCTTRLSPAMRRGEAVHSVRRIELETGG